MTLYLGRAATEAPRLSLRLHRPLLATATQLISRRSQSSRQAICSSRMITQTNDVASAGVRGAATVSGSNKQPSSGDRDYSKFFTERSAARQPSAIRTLQPLMTLPGMISLGGGNPNTVTFPFQDLTFTLKPEAGGGEVRVGAEDVQKALQYSPTNGLPEFVAWLKDLQTTVHQPPYQDYHICVGNGSQDVLTKAFEMLLDKGDSLLIEAPAYVGSLAFLKPLGCKFVEIPVDAQGLDPEKLESTLREWKDPSTRPKVLYTVPTGGNPTGISTSTERKRRIYDIAKQYDIIILEDDPYYYLQFQTPRAPTYFSLDTDRRVLRFDSLSKILSAGMRLGWVSGPKPLVDRIVLHGQTTLLHPSGVSQMLAYQLLNVWGVEGFLQHTERVTEFYRERRDAFLGSAERWLKGCAEWSVPDAGMFFWIKLLGISDSSDLIRTKAKEKKVLLVPGHEFFPNPRKTPYVRASYSTSDPADMDEALKRLAELVRDETRK
ncbi:pyridoxal phosphate-dependent transferase [Fimicolochytrium jonesii]|uniref:pyridoxal phosphate-dependent transferase n=1 Tax=Fimicolochytrium jonesii TaxID=1396493 RepID=UPI0022FE1F1E|nr:pyridoxal phosphate-dependent transferase [Fimicolochytrium jonesii]KAI8825257.1 pyridoxal phosphate-dependent transferase [Fimicolochytrium jonesii]